MKYEFGPFHYDAEQRLLFRGGALVPLVPKALDTLHVLLERRGTVVEKAELLKLVWPDTTVEDVGLARNISILRKALEDETGEQPWIETIPRRGYRFVGEVTAPAETPVRRPDRRRFVALTGVGAVIALAALIYWQFYVPSAWVPSGNFARFATVPFDCLCPDMDGERFSLGLNEVLMADLSRIEGVQLISPGTVQRYRRFGISMALMGRLLGLDILTEGTAQKLGSRLRITTRLVDVHTGRVLWADTRDENSADLAAAQQSVARAVTAAARSLNPSR